MEIRDIKKGRYLCFEERKEIERLSKTRMTLQDIGHAIGRSGNCVVVEVRLNGGRDRYSAVLAQESSDERHQIRNNRIGEGNRRSPDSPPRITHLMRIKSLEMQVQILSQTLKDLLDAKHN
jgi:IS30 family transposase